MITRRQELERLRLATKSLLYGAVGFEGSEEAVMEFGYVAMDPAAIFRVLTVLHHEDLVKPGMVSFDLGCGNGYWGLLAAASGLDSYGIDGCPELIDASWQNADLLTRAGHMMGRVQFAQGNMYPSDFHGHLCDLANSGDETVRARVPTNISGPGYAAFDRDLGDADLVYCWQWPIQHDLLVEMLSEHAPNALLVIPRLELRGSIERLVDPIPGDAYDFVIGRFR